MTSQEELTYLFGILSEASKWASSNDDPDSVRVEVEYRIRKLINDVVTEHDNLPAESENLTGSENIASPEKSDNARSKWERNKVRVYIEGRHVWKPRADCVKQPRDNSKGGPAWKWVWIDPHGKKAQEEEAMWAEHEAGNAE